MKLSRTNLISLLIIIVIILLLALLIYYLKKNIIITNKFKIKDLVIPDLPRPFVNLFDDRGNKINVVLVSHPFTRQKGDNGSYEQYKEWKEKHIQFIGVTSYSEFPSVYTNPYDDSSNPEAPEWKLHDYMKYFRLWLNCFRKPNKYIKDKTTKNILISESDFIDQHRFLPDKNIEKIYDFIYICLPDDDNKNCDKGWNYYIRNWKLAKKCFKIMCKKYKLKGLIIGRKKCKLPKGCKKYITMKDKLPQDELIKHYNQSRFLFLPNIVDASPRTLTECLSCDLRCLVNYNILGGWKYVNEHTGEFFNDENDLEPALNKLLDNYDNYNPSEFFRNNYGNNTTGVQLRDFLLKNLNNLNFNKNSTKYITMSV